MESVTVLFCVKLPVSLAANKGWDLDPILGPQLNACTVLFLNGRF